jgi:hypothetical protein
MCCYANHVFPRMCCQPCFWQHILGKINMIGRIFWEKNMIDSTFWLTTWLAAHSGRNI